MAITGENDGERSGDDRSPKRQRFPSLDEEEDEEDDEDFDPASITEEDEEEEDEEEELGEEEEDVTETRMATIRNEDLTREEQLGSPKSSQSVKFQSTEFLDCPICCEPLTRPIYQVSLL